MNRFCYVSQLLPGKEEQVREHWTKEKAHKEAEGPFWDALQMTGFHAWLQGDRLIHCLEGASLDGIFNGLAEKIREMDPIALKVQQFYQEVLGRDYGTPDVKPQIECLSDVVRPGGQVVEKRCRCLPLRPEKEEEHRLFCRASDNEWLSAFGITRFTKWLQRTNQGPMLVIYTEHERVVGENRLQEAARSPAWQEVVGVFADHCGLKQDQLSPDIERLA